MASRLRPRKGTLLSNIWRTPPDPERGSSTSKRRPIDPALLIVVVALGVAFAALGVLLLVTGGQGLRVG
jgi:hypothetical protein